MTDAGASALSTAVEAALKAASDNPAEAVPAIEGIAQLKVTTQLLLDTNAGKQIKRLLKHADPSVAKAASSLVDTWKAVIKSESAGIPQPNGIAKVVVTSPPQSLGSKRSTEALTPDSKRQRGAPAPPAVKVVKPQPYSESLGSQGDSQLTVDQPVSPTISASTQYASAVPIPAKSGNPARDKTRLLFAEALHLAAPDVEGGDAAARAVQVENAIFAQNGNINQRYKAKVRSLSFNLKDPKNPDLRRRVLSGALTAEDLVDMRADELGSDSRKEANDKIREHASKEAERGQHMRKATTNQFQCGKCKERKCTYYQMQTRSADEPMTTFVTCVNCGNRWKFC